jgi:hypothetical protein
MYYYIDNALQKCTARPEGGTVVTFGLDLFAGIFILGPH